MIRGAAGASVSWPIESSFFGEAAWRTGLHALLGGTCTRKPEMRAERGAWALARFLPRKQLPGEKERNVLAGGQSRRAVPKRRAPSALRSFGKAFFPFSPVLETHGAQKRAKAHAPRSIWRPTAGFLHSLRLSSSQSRWHRLSSSQSRWHRLSSSQSRWHRLSSLWTTLGGTPRLQGSAETHRWQPGGKRPGSHREPGARLKGWKA